MDNTHSIEYDKILSGIHIGEHSFDVDCVKKEIYERCIKPGYNFVTIRTRNRKEINPEVFIEWAKYLADNKIYFVFLYTMQQAPKGRKSHLSKETVSEMKRVAGEYFLGDMIGETGSTYACKFPGYYNLSGDKPNLMMLKQDHPDMKSAEEAYLKSVSEYVDIDKELGMPNIFSVEATALSKYNTKSGVNMPTVELMCWYPDVMLPSIRGTVRGFESEFWGTYVAHEWYGGMRHTDILKRKRLEIAYKFAYLSGSHLFCLESGDELVTAYGGRFEPGSDICNDYTNALNYIRDLIKTDKRPSGGPKVKLAFVSGIHDAWGGWGGSSVWNQFHRKEWGHSDAEYSWRMLDEIGSKRQWYDIANYGDKDFSALPAYGMYDIIPAESTLDAMCKYDYLIFLGYNAMTDEVMDKLTNYVKKGGNLLMCAAHLNCNPVRNGEFVFPSAKKLEALFGVEYKNEIISVNSGVKFEYESLVNNIMYPGSTSSYSDPIYSSGYADYAKFSVTKARTCAYLCDDFAILDKETSPPAVIENKVGNGVATLVTSVNYPGNPAVYPLYRALVREYITMSARNCEIKVIGGDRLRYAVYEGNKIYLLNTDYDLPLTVKINSKGKELKVCVEPMELKTIQL